jgi:hypothetical protein
MEATFLISCKTDRSNLEYIVTTTTVESDRVLLSILDNRTLYVNGVYDFEMTVLLKFLDFVSNQNQTTERNWIELLDYINAVEEMTNVFDRNGFLYSNFRTGAILYMALNTRTNINRWRKITKKYDENDETCELPPSPLYHYCYTADAHKTIIIY